MKKKYYKPPLGRWVLKKYVNDENIKKNLNKPEPPAPFPTSLYFPAADKEEYS